MYDNIEFVICCAGESSRNFPHSKGMTHKSLMPFGDKRLIDYILDDIVRIGGHHITIVCRTTGIIKLYKRALQTDEKIVKKLQEKERPDIAEVLKSTFLPNDIDLKFVLQKHPIGTGQLLVCARKAIQERHVVLIFPDDVIVSRPNEKPYIQYLLDDFLLNPKRIMLSGVNRKDVSNNAILINQRLIEKQKNATTHFAGMSPIILPNQLIKFMKKQYRTKKKWAKKTGKEWFYSHSINEFLDLGAEKDGFFIDFFIKNNTEGIVDISLYKKGINDLMIDTGTLSLYEEGQLFALLKLSRYAKKNWDFVKKMMKEEQEENNV